MSDFSTSLGETAGKSSNKYLTDKVPQMSDFSMISRWDGGVNYKPTTSPQNVTDEQFLHISRRDG